MTATRRSVGRQRGHVVNPSSLATRAHEYGKEGHKGLERSIAADRASWPTDAFLAVLNSGRADLAALKSLRAVIKQEGADWVIRNQVARIFLGLTALVSRAAMRHMIRHQNPQQEEAVLGLVGLALTFCKTRAEEFVGGDTSWATTRLTRAGRLGCVEVLSDCRAFMGVLLKVPPRWLIRLRYCKYSLCERRFFWDDTDGKQQIYFCAPAHGTYHRRRLKSRR